MNEYTPFVNKIICHWLSVLDCNLVNGHSFVRLANSPPRIATRFVHVQDP